MFSQAAIHLQEVLSATQDTSREPNYNFLRSLLKAALVEVSNDAEQPVVLRSLAQKQINQAIAFTDSVRGNPMMGPPTMATMPPISPFAKPSRPYGFMIPQTALTPPGFPEGALRFTQGAQEREAFKQLVRAALNTIRRGL